MLDEISIALVSIILDFYSDERNMEEFEKWLNTF